MLSFPFRNYYYFCFQEKFHVCIINYGKMIHATGSLKQLNNLIAAAQKMERSNNTVDGRGQGHHLIHIADSKHLNSGRRGSLAKNPSNDSTIRPSQYRFKNIFVRFKRVNFLLIFKLS